ncbi:hypothetical protein FRB90_008669 [Tulasnella sp. 427]|nr:hypothetical protein FRB90_008669 [Tulasnella sp. 427]
MPPHRSALFNSSFPYHATFNPFVQESVGSPHMNEAAGPDAFEGMAKDMADAFAAAEGFDFNSFFTAYGVTSSERTTSNAAEDAPFPPHFPFAFPAAVPEHGPRFDGAPPPPPPFAFNFGRPYGFNWNTGNPEENSHPGSMPHNLAGASGFHPYDYGHTARGGFRGRFNPYARGGHFPHFHGRPHHPPPPFRGHFGPDGPFGFRGHWHHHYSPAPGMDEEFAKARQDYQDSFKRWFEKLDEMRNQMPHPEAAYDGHPGRGGFAPRGRGHLGGGRGRGGHHQFHPGRGRGGFPPFNAQFRPPPSGWTDGRGVPPPRSGPPPRSRSEPAYNEAPHASTLGVDIVEAWETYCAQWINLLSSSPDSTTNTVIKLSEIPWPLIVDTSDMRSLSEMSDKITAASVGEFILSPEHSVGIGHKKRIHHALKLYHPDRFEVSVVAKVQEGDRKAVRELGEIVAKCLNKLLEDEN